MKAVKRSRQTNQTVRVDPQCAAIGCDEQAAERRRIRSLLRLPMNRRTHFLRVKVGGGSAL